VAAGRRDHAGVRHDGTGRVEQEDAERRATALSARTATASSTAATAAATAATDLRAVTQAGAHSAASAAATTAVTVAAIATVAAGNGDPRVARRDVAGDPADALGAEDPGVAGASLATRGVRIRAAVVLALARACPTLLVARLTVKWRAILAEGLDTAMTRRSGFLAWPAA
jgi:hypothetical protein